MNKWLNIRSFLFLCVCCGVQNVSAYTDVQSNAPSTNFTVEYINRNAPVNIVGSIPPDVQTIINTIQRPERFRRVGAPLPKGFLLMGPPGVGKTTLARHIAKKTGCGIIIVSAAELMKSYVGTGAASIRDLFESARDYINGNVGVNSSVIIFIDEIDVIGGKRENGGDSSAAREWRMTLMQLCTEMEGAKSSDNIIVIAATNENERYLDPALRSRFTYIAHVNMPSENDRLEILRHYSKDCKCAPNVSFDMLSDEKYTGGYAGRDLKKLVEHIARIAANDMSIPDDKVAITQEHVGQGCAEFGERKRKELRAN